jgi:nicotinate-nucleotide--dimethylbenzimidazole phosphoribosyltransferase
MDLVQKLAERMPGEDREAMRAARARQDRLTKPQGSLGRLEALAIRLAGITANPSPGSDHKVVILMAGDHGVAAEGVSAYPPEVTAQMVANILNGGAAINVLCCRMDVQVVVVDMGVAGDLRDHEGLLDCKVGPGTGNLMRGPAMSREQAVQCIETGIRIVGDQIRAGAQLIGTGEMGIGNTTPSAAIAAALAGLPPQEVVGRGTGIDDRGLVQKIRVVKRALECNNPDRRDPIDVLAKVGGFEIGGLAGVILGAAAERIPVVIDGFISSSAALLAQRLVPQSRYAMIAAHRSAEAGHGILLQTLGLEPLLDLGMRLGEGTGAVLAMGLVDAAARIQQEMATFEEARVSDRI